MAKEINVVKVKIVNAPTVKENCDFLFQRFYLNLAVFVFCIYLSTDYIYQKDKWILQRCLMNQSFSCTVVLLQSLERQRTVYLDILGSYKQGSSVIY